MSRLRHIFRRNSLLRRWPAKLVLLGYVWMCCGGSIPTSLLIASNSNGGKAGMTKDRSVPFPCMDKACGCRNAEQCFKSCCCSSKAERIAWAKEHAVSAEYIALADEAEERPVAQKSCCAPKATASCCDTEKKPTSCCEKTAAPAKSSQKPTKDKQPSKHKEAGISMLAALRCAGLQEGALGVPLSLPMNLELYLPETAPWIGSIAMSTPLSSSPHFAPDAPPPRG